MTVQGQAGAERSINAAVQPVEPPRVALTFDAEHPDRPSGPDVDRRLLDLLARSAIAATFFVQGRWAEAYPDLVRRIRDDGHLIGSHSHYHVRLPLLSDAGLIADLASAEAAIVEAAGVDPKPWFRCPFGAGMDDPRVLKAIVSAGYRHVAWHVVGEDWDPDRAPLDVERTVLEGVAAHGDGAVVLLHTWPDRMLGAMPGIVDALRATGHDFVRIDALSMVPTTGSALDGRSATGPGAAIS